MADTNRWRPVAVVGGVTAALVLADVRPSEGAAEPVHSVTVSKDQSTVVVDGLAAGDAVRVELRRNGVQIGTALGTAPAGGVFELNHRVDNDTDPAVCWTGFTPEILGGDVVTVSSGAGVDEVVVTDIAVTQGPTRVDANTGIVRGTISGPVPPISRIQVETRGRTASDERFDGLAPGVSDGVTGSLEYVAPGRFEATFDGLSPTQMGAFLDSHPVTATHVSASGAAGSHSTAATYGGDARFTEDRCPAVARRAVTGTSSGAVNAAGVDRPLRVWGVSADASEVRVAIEDRHGLRRVWPATISGAGSQQSWSATCPAGSLRDLADGVLTISAEYIGDGGMVTGRERTIRKDTVAPRGPRIRPQGGAFRRSVGIRLGSPGARHTWYTLNGSRPGRNHGAEYLGRFSLRRSATLRAVAFDAAGNRSRVTSARFTRR